MSLKTKKKLLEKSMAVFAKKGYAEASVRDIVDAADVNVSAVKYYFGSKLGLYESILTLFVRFVRADITDHFQKSKALLARQTPDPQQAAECVYELFGELCKLLCSRKIPDDAVTIFLREYAQTTPSFKIVDKGLLRPVTELTARLIVAASGNTLTLNEAYLHTFPLLAELFVFKSQQRAIQRAAGWKRYGEKEISVISELCIRHTRLILEPLTKHS